MSNNKKQVYSLQERFPMFALRFIYFYWSHTVAIYALCSSFAHTTHVIGFVRSGMDNIYVKKSIVVRGRNKCLEIYWHIPIF